MEVGMIYTYLIDVMSSRHGLWASLLSNAKELRPCTQSIEHWYMNESYKTWIF